MAWNVALPVLVTLASPDDIYYLIRHLFLPLLIGVNMLLRRGVGARPSV